MAKNRIKTPVLPDWSFANHLDAAHAFEQDVLPRLMFAISNGRNAYLNPLKDPLCRHWVHHIAHLPNPWPENAFNVLLSPSVQHQQKNNPADILTSLAAVLANDRKKPLWRILERTPEPDAAPWLRLLLNMGWDPLAFDASYGATLFGYFVFQKRCDIVAEILAVCRPPRTRLETKAEHIDNLRHASPHALGSTLLHRFVMRDVIFGTDPPKAIAIIKLLLEHDPDLIVCRNAQGMTPAQLTASPELAVLMRQWEAEHEARMDRTALSSELHGKAQDAPASPTRKM